MTIRVFVSGQSNALGRYAGGDDWSAISADVRVWNNVNPLGSSGDAFVSASDARAAGTFENTDRNNFGVWFCDRVARDYFESVDMTIVARGGVPISVWNPSETTTPMLQACIAVWNATGQPPADVFLWHQGEGDVLAGDYDGWRQSFYELLTNLSEGGVIDQHTLIIIGGIALTESRRVVFSERALLGSANRKRIGYAAPNGLPTADAYTHFSGESLQELGSRRYFCAYQFLRGAEATGELYGGGILFADGITPPAMLTDETETDFLYAG